MQLVVSGHLCLVSQHLQSLFSEVPAPAFIAFMQSDISMPAFSAIIVSCDSLGCAAAHADAAGASVSERAIKIAKKARSGFRVQNPSKRYNIMKTLTGTSRHVYVRLTPTNSTHSNLLIQRLFQLCITHTIEPPFVSSDVRCKSLINS